MNGVMIMVRHLVLMSITTFALSLDAQTIASTPPMGWNSWDSFGFSLTESQYKANASVLADLKQYGWQYAAIDEGWYLQNPAKLDSEQFQYDVDGNGRFIPDATHYPSALDGHGFRSLADWTHKHGLKFGLHIVRGIPRVADPHSKIDGSTFLVGDAEDRTDLCSWDNNNYGVRDNAAGQAYYNSVIKLYADWGLDFLKVDCIADHPYKAAEIRMISNAIMKSGRPIVLSLSPGPTNLSHSAEVAELSQMWRIADDIWDGWSYPGKSWPNGLGSAFDNLAKWAPYAKSGNWPDADMLPWGQLTPHPGWGPPRASGLTRDEIRTQFTLWAVARSPLILGANLTRLDDFTRSLLTNREVIAVDQHAVRSEQIETGNLQQYRVWSVTMPSDHPRQYIAVFNLENESRLWKMSWKELNLSNSTTIASEVWTQKSVGDSNGLSVVLAPHGCALIRIGL